MLGFLMTWLICLKTVVVHIFLGFSLIFADKWECAELLVKHGANLNKTDCHFGTPLHAAVSKGCVHSAKVLLKAGWLSLTHLSLASLFWDIGRTRRPIWGYSVCLDEFHQKMR